MNKEPNFPLSSPHNSPEGQGEFGSPEGEQEDILRYRKVSVPKIILFSASIIFLLLVYLISAPFDFPINKIITVQEGATLKETAVYFKQERLVRSSNLFDILIRYSGHEKEIKAGKYVFSRPISSVGLTRRLIKGDYGVPAVKITIPEGSTVKNINKIFAAKGFENFEIKEDGVEGYLFPDTYFFSPGATAEEAAEKMTENLKSKITPDLEKAILESKRTFSQILTMASLIEKEAAKTEDRRIISGILWKRFDKKMLLQVDAAFVYAIGKNTYELTAEDLKIDSPYNTYKYIGLPPTPICNPGLDAISAAIFPETPPYWYYLSDKEGNIYYGKTFEEHKINKAKHLK